MTISYLPVNLVVIAAMVHLHLRVRPRLRILCGLLGFTLSISAVPLVRAVTERSHSSCCAQTAACPALPACLSFVLPCRLIR